MKKFLILLLVLVVVSLSGCAWLDSLKSDPATLEECVLQHCD